MLVDRVKRFVEKNKNQFNILKRLFWKKQKQEKLISHCVLFYMHVQNIAKFFKNIEKTLKKRFKKHWKSILSRELYGRCNLQFLTSQYTFWE